ncbi:MAG: putative tricarboxylic transport membrane protein [Alphaproteobacteria bacterium]|jgi:putative tricarboxylic transport membrane protein
MTHKISRLTGLAAGAVIAAGAAFTATTSVAQDFPPKTITIVLSHSLGGGQDRATRAFAKVWSKHLGTKLAVKPKNGASGRVGFDYWISQPRDGSTLLSSNIGTTSIMYVRQRPKWSWSEKVHFVGLIGIDPGAVFVEAKSPFKSIQDVIGAAKKGTVLAGLSSWDSPENMVFNSLVKQAGIKPFRVIPIGGGSDVVTSVLGKHLPVGFGKVSNISRGGKKVRFLAIAMDENLVASLTNNAPTLDKALGVKTIEVASYRAIIMPQELMASHPDRVKKLKTTFEAAKDDKAFIKLAKKVGLSPSLIVDWDNAKLQSTAERYWAAYQDNSNMFKIKVKDIKAKITIAKIKSKGKYVYFKDKDGKEWKMRLHDRSTKFWLDGKRQKGKKAAKKAFAKLKVGHTCDITYAGLPLRARTAKCATK